ncbi:MAG: N-acetylornithine carbamoyltransferase [Fimbriimonadaceae bacterium]
MHDFLTLRTLKPSQIQELVNLAKDLKANPINDSLKGKVIGLLFMNPSLRTLASFQAGIGQMGGTSVVIQPGTGTWTLETRDGVVMDGPEVEHIREAIPVLASYCDILGIRSFANQTSLQEDLADGLMHKFAELSPKPLINMESASDHPCQALADWLTLDELNIPQHGNFVLSWAWHPKPLPYAVPRAALSMASLRGMNITIHCPESHQLPIELYQEAEQLGASSLRYSHNSADALENAQVLYCKSWVAPQNYGNPEAEQKSRQDLRDWCVRKDWFKTADPDAKFMHCLPVRRNVKVADEILDGSRSVVIQQAENRLHAQKAILQTLIK